MTQSWLLEWLRNVIIKGIEKLECLENDFWMNLESGINDTGMTPEWLREWLIVDFWNNSGIRNVIIKGIEKLEWLENEFWMNLESGNNNTGMTREWLGNDSGMTTEWLRNDSEMTPEWLRNDSMQWMSKEWLESDYKFSECRIEEVSTLFF